MPMSTFQITRPHVSIALVFSFNSTVESLPILCSFDAIDVNVAEYSFVIQVTLLENVFSEAGLFDAGISLC